jgi:protein-S-isoprenylcysteine O-methyltransferase Ste14
MLRPYLVIITEWILFAVSWLLAARWSSAIEKQLGMRKEIGYRMLMVAGGVLEAVPAHGYYGPLRLWLVSGPEAWACILIIAGGFGFAWWARLHLGELWSAHITAKENHRIVDSGPYAIVRHPIYTGILAAVVATTAAKGTVMALAGMFLIVLGVWIKARIEERWLSSQLEADAYQQYRRKVPMLMPFGRTAG